MTIKHAVITAAGRDQHRLPLQNLVDRDGRNKPAIQIICEEIQSVGIEELCLVVCPDDQDIYASALRESGLKIHFAIQSEPRGYGHALLCATDFLGGQPFLHLVSDHLYLSTTQKRCAQQLVDAAREEDCAVSAVQPTREGMLPFYGAIGGRGLDPRARLYQIDKVLEKPTPTVAEQELVVPGLRAGYYLCFFGMHVFTAKLIDLLRIQAARSPALPLALSPALAELARHERYLACEIQGRRYNLGQRFGLLHAQLALALAGQDRDEVLSQLVELLATRPELPE